MSAVRVRRSALIDLAANFQCLAARLFGMAPGFLGLVPGLLTRKFRVAGRLFAGRTGLGTDFFGFGLHDADLAHDFGYIRRGRRLRGKRGFRSDGRKRRFRSLD